MSDGVLLVGGDMNVVVRVGDTVRRPPEPRGVQELLCWYEHVGFAGAPRFLGLDEQGREMGTRIDEQLLEWGIPLERRGERLRILCDAYGLDRVQRASLLPELVAHRRDGIARGAIRGTTRPETVLANLRWTEDSAAELGTFLS